MLFLFPLLACKEPIETDSAVESPRVQTWIVDTEGMALTDATDLDDGRWLVTCPACPQAQALVFPASAPPAALSAAPVGLYLPDALGGAQRAPRSPDAVWLGATFEARDVAHTIAPGAIPAAGPHDMGQLSAATSTDGYPQSGYGQGAAWINGVWHTAAPARNQIPPTLYALRDGVPYIFGPIDPCGAQVDFSCAVDRRLVGDSFWYTADGGFIFRWDTSEPVFSAFKIEENTITNVPNSSVIEDTRIHTRLADSHDGVYFVGTWSEATGEYAGGIEFISTPVGGNWETAYSRDSGEIGGVPFVVYGMQEGMRGWAEVRIEDEVYTFELGNCPAPLVRTDGGSTFVALCEEVGNVLLVGELSR